MAAVLPLPVTTTDIYVVVGALWLCLVAWLGRPSLLVLGVLAANGWLWLVTNAPLQRLYGVGVSSDRLNNLAMCQLVAVGQNPWGMPYRIQIEPFWSLLVAAASGFEPERVLILYPFLSLLVCCGLVLTVYQGFKSLSPDRTAAGWEAASMAAFATLLCSMPLDHAGIYRNPWALTMLLKPNHALGLVLFPPVCWAVANASGRLGALRAALLLGLLGFVFIVHFAFVYAGLALWAAWSWWAGTSAERRRSGFVGGILGLGLVGLLPHLVHILRVTDLVASTGHTLAPRSAHLAEPTFLVGFVFPLAVWGAVVLARRSSPLARLLVSQWVASGLLWVGYLGLDQLQLAREPDELYFWLRFLTAMIAGVGAWDLTSRCALLLAWPSANGARAACLMLVVLPWSQPYWWDPARMDEYYRGSLDPLPEALRRPTDFIRQQTPRAARFAAEPEFARYILALGGRDVLIVRRLDTGFEHSARRDLLEALARGEWTAEVQQAAARFGVTHLAVTSGMFDAEPTSALASLSRAPHLREVFSWGRQSLEFVVIFALKVDAP